MVQILLNQSLKAWTEEELRPVKFAAEELEKYLLRMGAPKISLTLSVDPNLSKNNTTKEQDQASFSYDPRLDDRYEICVKQADDPVEKDRVSGQITGNNPRAVLLGAYRYLTMIGCRFLKPGPQNEWIPYQPDPAGYKACDYVEAALPGRRELHR